MKILKKLKLLAIREVFNRYYKHFEYAFTDADVIRFKMPEPTQQRYYEDVYNWVNSEAFDNEHKSMVKNFYKELALKSLTDEQIAGYRLALIFIKNYEGRLSALAEEYKLLKKTSKLSDKLK